MRWLAIALMLAGCGRIEFDPLGPCGPSELVDQPYANSRYGADGIGEPFLICTASQLQAMSLYPERTFVLARDIELGGVTWTPIGTRDLLFTGTFDGDGHVIRNLRIDQPMDDEGGLFGRIGNGGHVSNVRLENVDITALSYVGGLAGWVEDSVSIENVHVDGRIDGDSEIGGVVGFSICNAQGSQIAMAHLDAQVDLVGSTDVGGVVGSVYCGGPISTLSFLTSAGTIMAQGQAGGIVGYLSGASLDHSSSTMSVTGDTLVGGLVGIEIDAQTEIADSFATGDITCINGDNCAGAVGYVECPIMRSYATGNVDCGTTGFDCGGLAGFLGNDVAECYATGNVRGATQIGGLLGEPYGGIVRDSYSTGMVNGSNGVGGLIGQVDEDMMVTNCFSTSIVVGTQNVGGLAGAIQGVAGSPSMLTNSFFSGSVSGNTVQNTVAPIAGRIVTGTQSGNAVSGTCANTSGTCATQGTTTSQSALYSPSTPPLTTWDFSGVWQENAGALPTLRNVPP